MGARCPFPACDCLHIGCSGGWFELTRKDGSEYVQPCPRCRPGSAAQRRAGLRSLPRPSREPERPAKKKSSKM
jgi:hypothetical protein